MKAISPRSVQASLKPHKQIKNIIAVASGKGGVGKSTVAVNIALALQHLGYKTGLLDADIYGPSQPLMLGINAHPESLDGKTVEPLIAHGLQVMSIGFLVDQTSAMIWRGPMVSGALQQLIRDTQWKNLDFLIVDLPPGTGDVQLTMSQKIPVAGSIIVTTPQDIALMDVRRAIEMFKKVKITSLGVVENMSSFICPNCNHEEHLFGSGGAKEISKKYDLDCLGQIPLSRSICEATDSGKPTVLADPDSELAKPYFEIADKMIENLERQPKDYSGKFGDVVVE